MTSIFPFRDTILLRWIWCCQESFDTLFLTIVCENDWHVFSTYHKALNWFSSPPSPWIFWTPQLFLIFLSKNKPKSSSIKIMKHLFSLKDLGVIRPHMLVWISSRDLLARYFAFFWKICPYLLTKYTNLHKISCCSPCSVTLEPFSCLLTLLARRNVSVQIVNVITMLCPHVDLQTPLLYILWVKFEHPILCHLHVCEQSSIFVLQV